jgi:hypothetical protein
MYRIAERSNIRLGFDSTMTALMALPSTSTENRTKTEPLTP